MECSSSHSQCESVAKSSSEAMMDLMKLRADGSGGGQTVLNFVGLGAELMGQATGWKERACGSEVSSLKRKKSSVTVQSTVFECRSQELRWVLREYSSLSGQFSGGICVSQEIIMSWTWCHLCLSRAGFLATSITFTSWCGLAVTIHCPTIAGSMLLWTYNRCQQSPLWKRIDWVSLVGAEYIYSSSSFSNSTPLFLKTVRGFFCDFLQWYYFASFFFFSREKHFTNLVLSTQILNVTGGSW